MIIHHKSCPYTSQQNDLAERKLLHILKTGLTLLAYSHLSNKYFVDAFLTSMYLINRLPTLTLDNVSPFFKLHQKEPNYQQLKVFGCKCYPLLQPLGLHKLEFRSKPCMFLGYSYAGYKCLDPITNKVYLLCHVVFDEQTFPTKDDVTSQLPFKVNATGDLPLIPPVSSSSLDICHSSYTTPINFATAANPNTNSLLVSSSRLDISHNSCTTLVNSAAVVHPSTNSLILPSSHSYEPSLSLSDAQNTPGQSTIPDHSITPSKPPLDSHSTTQELILSPSAPFDVHPMTTRSWTRSLKPKTFSDFHLYHTIKHPLKSYHTTLQESEPSCFSKASLDP